MNSIVYDLIDKSKDFVDDDGAMYGREAEVVPEEIGRAHV